MRRRLLLFLATSAVLAVSAMALAASRNHEKGTIPTKIPTQNPTQDRAKEERPVFDKSRYPLTDPKSFWIIANKTRPLQPKDYAPTDLVVPDMKLRPNITGDERQVRLATAEALHALSEAAKKEDIILTLESGYRSYRFQANLYERYVREQGQATADTQSARPGYSEHQTGLAADIGGVTQPGCNVESCYAATPEGKWLAANAYRYGFIIRYPEGKTAITGYIYEPWHLRYVGADLSTEMHDKGIQTLEEFFDLPAAPDYN